MKIPDYKHEKAVDEKGYFTVQWQQFFDQLSKQLQMNAGEEGLVMPTQPATSITTIQNNQNIQKQYTTQFGTLIYDSTDNTARLALNDGTGKPTFKTITTS